MKNQIKERREQRKLTLGQIAQNVGVCRSYVYKIEKGSKEPNARVMLKLAKLLGCAVEELFFE